MKEKIKQSVKTLFAKYGLKDTTRDKFVNMVETAISAMGTIENEDEVIATEVAKLEPFAQMVQSELDAVRASQPQNQGQQPTAQPTQPNQPAVSEIPEWAKGLQNDIELIKKQKENEAKEIASKEKMNKALDIMKDKGALNEVIRDIAIRFIDVTEDMTPEQIAEQGNAMYNSKYKELYGDGASPANSTEYAFASNKGGLEEFKKQLVNEGLIPINKSE